MAFRNMRYYFKSAASSFVRNGIMTIASFITVACALFLFGVFLMFTMNLNYISEQIEAQCELQAYFPVETDNATQQSVYNKILNTQNVKNAKLETKEQALSNFKKRLGKNASVLEGLEGQDFLRSSIKITLKDIREADATAKEIQKIKNVEEVKNRQDIVRKVVKFTDVIEQGSFIAMLILLLIAVFIIKNTIKLSVHARGKEIEIMKFVGATNHFIRVPFVLEGIMIGVLGFIVSFAVIALGYGAVVSSISSIISLFSFLPLENCIVVLGVSMAVFGIIMGATGSGLSLRKHLKV